MATSRRLIPATAQQGALVAEPSCVVIRVPFVDLPCSELEILKLGSAIASNISDNYDTSEKVSIIILAIVIRSAKMINKHNIS